MTIARTETPATPADASAIERSLRDPEAFAALFDRHAAHIHRYVARRVGGVMADDILGETFARAFQHRRRYDLSRPDARPWLYGIASHLINDHRRAETRRLRAMARAAQVPVEEPRTDRLDEKLTAQGQKAGLARALAKLPAGQRDVVLLHAWAELDYEQIARALGIPVGTVRSRLHRARGALRTSITTNTDEGGRDPWTS